MAIVGAGLMGRAHASAAIGNGARVVFIADASIERAAALARLTGARAMTIPGAFASEADIVHVCTPPSEHVRIVRAALHAGKHVLCEKPLAQSAVDVIELHRIAGEKGLTLCPSLQMPFQRGVRRFVDAKSSLGVVRHVSAEVCTAGAEDLTDEGRSRILADILPHPLSVSRAFGASPFSNVEWKVVSPMQGELMVSGVAGGIGLSFLLSTRGRPTNNSMRVIADAGTVTLDLFHGYSVFERGTTSRFRKLTRPFAGSGLTVASATANGLRRAIEGETSFPGLRELVKRFYLAVAGEAASPISVDESVDIAAARDGIMTTRDRID